MESVDRAVIVERDIISFQGQLSLKGSEVFMDEIELQGTQLEISVNLTGFEKTLQSASDAFYQEALQSRRFVVDHFYNLVNCQGGDEDDGNYNVFMA